eukprot:12427221-Alexandrium_andersonii.AAC.1
MHRRLRATGDDLLTAQQPEINATNQRFASRRRNYRADPATYKLPELLTACQVQRLQESETLRARSEVPEGPWFSDVQQNPTGGASTPGVV